MRLCTCRHRRPRSYCGYIRLYILTRKHLFISALFTDYPIVVNCRYCASASTNVKKPSLVLFDALHSSVQHVNKTWCWESQPYVGNIPAGNIYTPAAMLYTGAFPDFEVCNNHEQDFPSASEQHPSTKQYKLHGKGISCLCFRE